MEFLKLVRRRRSFVSELIYMTLNIALAVGVTLIVLYTGSIWMAIALVMVSKWRVFAVRPRYWWVNFQSNLVDFIVSVSFVLHISIVNEAPMSDTYRLLIMGFLTVIYILWLLYLKPRSSRHLVALQGGVAIILGSSALFAISYAWPVSLVVIGMWLIGYVSARHTLSAYDNETQGLFLSLAWGLIFAEIGWVAYHWTVAYSLPVFPSLQVPQVTIILALMSFVAYKAYDSFFHHGRVRSNDVLLPLLLAVSSILILVIIFNRVGTAI